MRFAFALASAALLFTPSFGKPTSDNSIEARLPVTPPGSPAPPDPPNPPFIYRFDTRAPSVIKAGGGFTSKGNDPTTQANLFKHCGPGSYPADPFISTTPLNDLSHHGDYRYRLQTSKIPNKIWNVASEYARAGKKNDYAAEEELSVEHAIPWAAVVEVAQFSEEQFNFLPIPMPKKRAAFAHDARRAEIEAEAV